MFRPPKIIITNVDEDPAVKKVQRLRKYLEIAAVSIILVVNWCLVLTRTCFPFGLATGTFTTLLTLIEYSALIRSRFAVRFGRKRDMSYYHERASLAATFRFAHSRLLFFLQNRFAGESQTLPK